MWERGYCLVEQICKAQMGESWWQVVNWTVECVSKEDVREIGRKMVGWPVEFT